MFRVAIFALISVIYASTLQRSLGFVSLVAPLQTTVNQAPHLYATGNPSDDDGKVKKKNKSTIRKTKSTEPNYWHDEDDHFFVATAGDIYTSGGGDNNKIKEDEIQQQTSINNNEGTSNPTPRKGIKFTIRGNPRVLIRHRTARGFMYNPSRASQEQFRDCVLKLLPRRYHPTIVDDICLDNEDDEGDGDITPTVLFAEHEFLKLSVVFRMKRPKSHFVSNKPGPGRLKPTAPGKLHIHRSDVDNLAKFVMDSLNGLIYVDDKQVIKLSAVKVLDSEGLCRGATDVEISVLTEDDFLT